MKICIQLEAKSIIKVSGILSSYENQKKALELNKIPFTTSIEDDFDVIDFNLAGPKTLRLIKKMRKAGKKIVIHCHVTPEDYKGTFSFGSLIYPVVKRYLIYAYKQADLIIAPSEYTKNLLLKHGIKNEIKVVSNGVDVNYFKFSAKERKKFRKKHAIQGIMPISVGFVTKRKGIATFIRVAKKFPNNKFFWFGKKNSFLETGDIKNIPNNLHFYGFIKDTRTAYSAADIFFFPSHEENQGIVILEAGTMGLPVLVRDIPVYRGWLFHGKNCFKAKNDKEFAKYLSMLINDEKLRKKMGRAAKKLAYENRLEKIGKELKKVYESLYKG